ncbi:hypothetical protein EYF80_021098 [Liparis tanakae]|uniref:Uncharacterized protein n=1 Tax=Liparis tanakae TaxID=230148 RepID=A0A4Z2HS67_9TELE|nr:hypothetical protein EYF80_021098 [Liparis tanakae]
MAFPYEGVASAAQLHLAGGRAGGLLGEADIVAAVETAQTQRPGAAQQHGQQRGGPTAISLEEQKILLSLDRLDHQLYRVRAHVGADTGSRGLVLTEAPSMREVKVTSHHKHRASSANNRTRYQKKF